MDGRRVGYIPEMAAIGDELAVQRALLAEAVGFLDREGVELVASRAVPGTPLERALRRAGFLFSWGEFRLQMVPVQSESVVPLCGVCGGDFDVVQHGGAAAGRRRQAPRGRHGRMVLDGGVHGAGCVGWKPPALLAGRRFASPRAGGRAAPGRRVSIGCAGTLVLHKRAGAAVIVACVTDGRTSRALGLGPEEMARRRRLGADDCARRLGIDALEWLGLPGGTWRDEQLAERLAALTARQRRRVQPHPSRRSDAGRRSIPGLREHPIFDPAAYLSGGRSRRRLASAAS